MRTAYDHQKSKSGERGEAFWKVAEVVRDFESALQEVARLQEQARLQAADGLDDNDGSDGEHGSNSGNGEHHAASCTHGLFLHFMVACLA